MSTKLEGGLGLKSPSITDTVNELINTMAFNMAILDKLHPVGDIIMTTTPGNPSSRLGGTWEQLTGRFIVGADDNAFKIGVTGGRSDMGVETNYKVANAEGAPAEAANAGLIKANATGEVGFQGRVMVTYQDWTGQILPPYYPAYIWHRVA